MLEVEHDRDDQEQQQQGLTVNQRTLTPQQLQSQVFEENIDNDLLVEIEVELQKVEVLALNFCHNKKENSNSV